MRNFIRKCISLLAVLGVLLLSTPFTLQAAATTYYRIYPMLNIGNVTEVWNVIDAAGHSYYNEGNAFYFAQDEYSYTVTFGCNVFDPHTGSGLGYDTKSYTVPGLTKCSTPSISISGSNSSISYPIVSWSAVTGASKYSIEVDGSTYYSTSSTSYTLSSVSKGTTHTVRVQAIAGTDYCDSSWSSSRSFINAYCTPIGAPNITLSGATSSTMDVSWSAVTRASSYVVEWSTSSSFTSKQEKTVTGTSATITGLNANTTYYVRAKSNTTTAYYADSNYGSVKNLKTAQLPLDAPTCSLGIADANSLLVSYTTVAGATGYIVEYSTNTSFTNKKTLTVT